MIGRSINHTKCGERFVTALYSKHFVACRMILGPLMTTTISWIWCARRIRFKCFNNSQIVVAKNTHSHCPKQFRNWKPKSVNCPEPLQFPKQRQRPLPWWDGSVQHLASRKTAEETDQANGSASWDWYRFDSRSIPPLAPPCLFI